MSETIIIHFGYRKQRAAALTDSCIWLNATGRKKSPQSNVKALSGWLKQLKYMMIRFKK